MRKTLFVLVVFALLVGVKPADAQYVPSSPEGWYYSFQGDQVAMLQADNLAMVDRFMGMGRHYQWRRLTDDLVSYGAYVGLQGSRGFYPMYHCGSKTRRVMNGVGRTMMAAGVGYLAGRFIDRLGEREGTIAGAGIGAGWALMKDSQCAPVQNQMVVIDDPSDLGVGPATVPSQMPSRRENGWNEVLRRQRGQNAPLAGPAANRGSGEFTLVNATRFPVDVYDEGPEGDIYLGRMRSDEKRYVGAPSGRYVAYAIIPNVEGGLSSDKTDRHPSDNGWVFIEPSFGSGR